VNENAEIPFRIETIRPTRRDDLLSRRLVAFVTWFPAAGGGRMFTDPSLVPGVHPIDANDGWMNAVIEPRARALRERRDEAERQQEGRLW
jgi:hypothetical protein